MPSVPLRRRLFLLAAGAIVPLALVSGIGLYLLTMQQRVQVERVSLEFTRAVATAVDAELRSSISVLEAFATTLTLEGKERATFHEQARRVLGTQPTWAGMSLTDPAGTRVADTRYPPGADLPAIAERESLDRVVRTRTPAIGSLARSARGPFLFAVRVPVLRGDALQYVLSASVRPEEIRDVVTRQQVPRDWVVSIFDQRGQRVARSRAHEESLGGPASPSLQALLALDITEGSGPTYTLEGERIYTPYVRLAPSGWTAALGLPATVVEGAVYRSLAFYGGGLLLSLGLGTLAALVVARSINRPIADLRGAAQALGRGEGMPPPVTTIQEIRDVAEALVTAAAERRHAEVQERLARETAEAADRAKEQFLAVLSHELRTPLNAVYGWARMLQAGQLDGDDATRAVEAIVRNADMQVQLIDDLLDVSRIVSGKMRLDVRAVDLAAVLQDALDAVRPAAEAKAIRVQRVLDPRAGPVMGDPARLQQVLWNLLMNAVKFTPKGGRVQVHLQRVNSHVEIMVSDTGQGIASEVLPYVFDRFRQSDSSSTRAHGGLGLGLALVKHLVELHGGSVLARSAGEGMGATFVVSLPLSIAELPEHRAPRVHPSALSAAPLPGIVRLDGLRVLVVDDDPEAVALGLAILTGAGAEVRSCLAAPDALTVLRQWRPDVLVSDIEMPVEDGYALIAKVRALGADEGGRTPAVALTAYGRMQDRMRSLAAGYTMHVPKPVDPGELTTIIASVAMRPPTHVSGPVP
ncbi:MAG TPA: ATP-binding protein [Verrucomicrobiae bacterium]|nr:ATP-binding protein [Verrucomicrobiae bacterium]